MRHRVHGRHLGRDTAHRTSLYRNLVTDLLRYERITTTEAKAKEIRPMAERIITLGRKGGLHNRRQAARFVLDDSVVSKVFDDIGPRMRDRPGGYTRITGIEPRKGDGARMASIELMGFVDAPPTPRPQRVTAAPRTTAPAAAVEEADAPADDLAVEDAVIDDSVDALEAGAETAEIVDEVEQPAAEATETPAEAEAESPADEPADEAETPADGEEKQE